MLRKTIFLILFSLFLVSSFGCQNEQLTVEQIVDTNEIVSIDELTSTENFSKNALIHIFEGEINRKGEAVGYHYEGIPNSQGEVIEGTETELNEFGIYEAEVQVKGIKKKSNRGRSTFFPKNWSAQHVVDKINEAYETKDFIHGNTYEGMTSEGIIIRMYLNHDDKIISAFPLYE